MIRWVVCLFLLLAGCAPESRQQVTSTGTGNDGWTLAVASRSVPVHLVRPATPPPWPTVMLLHGASGLGRGYLIWPVARALAARGVAAAVVEYFDAMPDQIGRKGAVRHFSARERLLNNIVDGILAQPEVLGPQIGVYGYSLGGFHGLALAATDRRIAAVVSLAGGLPRHVQQSRLGRAAPVLLVHGSKDTIVPFSRASETVAAWQTYGRPIRLMTLPGTGHVPRGQERTQLSVVAADFLAKEMLFRTALK